MSKRSVELEIIRRAAIGYEHRVRDRRAFLFLSGLSFLYPAIVHSEEEQFDDLIPLKLTTKQKRFVNGLKGKLKSKLNPKGDPDDANTWYVLMFINAATGARQSVRDTADYRITTLEIQSAQDYDARMVQGRDSAALLLAQFLYSLNSAATKLEPTQGGTTQAAHLEGRKDWRFKAFLDEVEAKTFFELVRPKKDDKPKPD